MTLADYYARKSWSTCYADDNFGNLLWVKAEWLDDHHHKLRMEFWNSLKNDRQDHLPRPY